LFSAIDVVISQSSSPTAIDRLERTLEYVEIEIKNLSQNVRNLAMQTDIRIAQQQYLIGMLPGLAIVVGLIIGVSYLHFSSTTFDISIPSVPNGFDLGYVIGGGAVGALLSVLGRTTSARLSKSLQVDTQAGAPLIISAGAFRPVVGALLAVSLYVLIGAGLLPIAIPKESSQGLFFISAISLLAGFSERLAQDSLVRTSRSIFSSGRSKKPDTND
jgi:hypothetical protein